MLVSNENAALEDLEVVVFTSFRDCVVRLLLVMMQDKEGFLWGRTLDPIARKWSFSVLGLKTRRPRGRCSRNAFWELAAKANKGEMEQLLYKKGTRRLPWLFVFIAGLLTRSYSDLQAAGRLYYLLSAELLRAACGSYCT